MLQSAQDAGLTSIISNGLNPEDNAAVLALAEAHPIVRPAVGLYPVDAVLAEMQAAGIEYPREAAQWTGEEAVQYVEEHADHAIAVGEIGLDGHWVPSEFWDRQEELFKALVTVAMKADKPIIIHSRKREKRAWELLEELGCTRVDWHCFGGKVKLSRRIAASNPEACFSIPANVRRSESFTRMVQTLPRTQILLETDCPYLPPERGTTNEPQTVAGTVACIAELWDETQEATAEQLQDNYRRLFQQDP